VRKIDIIHKPVLLKPVLEKLIINNNLNYFLDCTLGEGGHSEAILKSNPNVRVVGIDRDIEIIKIANERLKDYSDRFISFKSNFIDIDRETFLKLFHSKKWNIKSSTPEDNTIKDNAIFDVILIDLGISTFHYKASGRGFSIFECERLDMRLDNSDISAFDVVNSYSYEDLVKIFFQYGEEKFSREIAKRIVKEREKKVINYTNDLASIVKDSIPVKFHKKNIHPATKVFQAIRIEVNHELDNIKKGIDSALKLLKPNGKIGVITFHSLEDRIVKEYFNYLAKECICPPKFPKCVCDKKAIMKDISKPISPDYKEIEDNPPARSSKLRIGVKV